MTNCKWDGDAGEYLRPDGEPCRRDDYGDPTNHCTSRRTCTQHVGHDELTCARCIGRTRTDIAQIVQRAALMLPEALEVGVNSEAANLAGPAADYQVFSARRRLDKRWIMAHIPEQNQARAMSNLIDDDDELHPHSVLTRWAMMLAEDYNLALPDVLTISNAAEVLNRVLHRMAQDDEQDWPLFGREIRRCRSHMESVLRDSQALERGAPCPTCAESKRFVRLQREYGHWCEDANCERIHYDTDEGDQWVCPRNRQHAWTEMNYRSWVEERGA